ncbi:polysaccharide deacetylase family protein [Pseudidiomarina sp.]|uniref:polysaccharide deacetylase family protein n=1 Tax=Pseudidiomarina sp. TaxID=2081707 RepID=UPI003A973B59
MRFMLIVLGLMSCVSWAAPGSVAVLQYHHIGDDTPRVTSVTAEELEAHFAWLKENDFTVLSVGEIQRRFDAGESLPEYTAAITFDDGWRNVYREGLAIFKEYQYPFTIFVNPKLMREASSQYMGWEQLRELQKHGAQIANHTNSHWHMTWRYEDETEQQWRERVVADVLDAQREIDENLGEQPRHLAYPYGEYDVALQALLQQHGFIAFGQHSGPWTSHSPATAIPRFPASAQYAKLETLGTKMKSLGLPITDYKPQEMLVSEGQLTPSFTVSVATTDDFNPGQMNCFAGGQVLQPEWDGNTFTVQLEQPLPIGRSRVNCTVPSKSQAGRFYWYSHPFIRADERGRWPD